MPASDGLTAWIVILAGVAAALYVGKLPPAIPALQAELGLTFVQAGFLLSLVQLASMALGLVAGLMAEGLGLRRCVIGGLWLLALAGLAGGFAQSAAGLLALRAVEGVGVLLVTVPAPSLIRRSLPPSQLTRMPGAAWATVEKSKLPLAVPSMAMPRNMKPAPTVLNMKYFIASRRASPVSSCTSAT